MTREPFTAAAGPSPAAPDPSTPTLSPPTPDLSVGVSSRRRALLAGGAAAGGLLTAGLAGVAAAQPAAAAQPGSVASARSGGLPVKAIEGILRADGTVSNGVLGVDINRSDLRVHGPGGFRLHPGFQLQHEFYFEALPAGRAVFNGDLAVTAAETQPVIRAILAHGLVFQAFHQHLYSLEPEVWFIHVRGAGNPLHLARAVAAVVAETGAPLPQTSPAHPMSPLPAAHLGRVLGGEASIGDSGVVTVVVARTDRVVLGGVRVSPELGISTNIQFQPQGRGGNAAVVPDFSMTAREVTPVIGTMAAAGWTVGCLYNQEIGESPQLFYSHLFKTGNALTLAHQIRRGLDHTATRRP